MWLVGRRVLCVADLINKTCIAFSISIHDRILVINWNVLLEVLRAWVS